MVKDMEIIVDDREKSTKLMDALSARGDVVLRVERLPLGDYLIDNKLLIERKTIMDLVVSIKDGRLFSQACRLVESDYLAAVLLEGTGADFKQTGMRREAVQGALVTLTLYLGLPVLRSRDANESARIMFYAARQGRAIVQDTLQRRGRRAKGKRTVQSKILQGLPLVGPQRAKQLLDHFGCVERTLTAGVDELQQVEGIGKNIAETLRWAVKENAAEYAVQRRENEDTHDFG